MPNAVWIMAQNCLISPLLLSKPILGVQESVHSHFGAVVAKVGEAIGQNCLRIEIFFAEPVVGSV